MSTFDRDAVIQVLESERGRDISPIVRAAARWAVEVTEGDGIWWCERHQRRWGYTWSPRGASVSEVAAAPDRVGGGMRVVEIVTECEHGKSDPHRWDPSTTISDEGWCPGGSRRVLGPGEYVVFRSGGSIGRVGGSHVPDSDSTCLRCGGSGLVLTDELREKATDTLLHVLYLGSDRSQLGSTQVRMHERAADAVLRLVAEHLGERE